MSAPWGHKITVSIYVAGPVDLEWVRAITDHLVLPPDTTFTGMTVDTVQDEPKDQR